MLANSEYGRNDGAVAFIAASGWAILSGSVSSRPHLARLPVHGVRTHVATLSAVAMADAPPPAAAPEEGEARDSRADDYARGRMASDGRDPYRDDDRLRRDPRYEDRRPDDRHRRPDDRYDDRRRYDDRYDRRDDRRYDRRCEP